MSSSFLIALESGWPLFLTQGLSFIVAIWAGKRGGLWYFRHTGRIILSFFYSASVFLFVFLFGSFLGVSISFSVAMEQGEKAAYALAFGLILAVPLGALLMILGGLFFIWETYSFKKSLLLAERIKGWKLLLFGSLLLPFILMIFILLLIATA